MPRKKRRPKKCPHCGGLLPLRRGVGQKPYGEDARHPDEFLGVDEITTLRSRGWTMRAIAEGMEEMGYPLRRGAKWNPGTVWRIIRREEKKQQAGQRTHRRADGVDPAEHPDGGAAAAQ
jgi:hypothetical protein